MIRRWLDLNSALIALILAVGFGLRLFQITSNSLWIDEAYSFFLSSLDFKQIVRGTIADQHPPLYYVILHFWMLLGHDEFTLRILSAVLGTVSIAVLYKIGRHLFSPQIGLVAALLLSISPVHIWYSQEVRMYVLLTLLSMVSIYLFWLLFDRPRRWPIWAGWIIVNLTALYTHNLAIFVLIFENVFWFGALLTKKVELPTRSWLIAQIIVFLGYAPWLPVLVLQATQHPMPWIPHPTPVRVGGIFLRLAFGDSRFAHLRTYLELGIALLLVIAVVRLGIERQRWHKPLLFVFFWFLVPFIGITAVSFRVSLYQDKQLLFLAPALMLIFALGVAGLKFSRLQVGMIFLMMGLLLLPLHDQYFVPKKTDWRRIAVYIDEHVQPDDVIYLNAASNALPLNFYLTRRDIPQEGYPHVFDFERGGWDGQVATQAIVESQMRRLTATYKRIWLIDYGSNLWDPQSLILGWFSSNCHLLGSESYSGVRIELYETDSETGRCKDATF